MWHQFNYRLLIEDLAPVRFESVATKTNLWPSQYLRPTWQWYVGSFTIFTGAYPTWLFGGIIFLISEDKICTKREIRFDTHFLKKVSNTALKDNGKFQRKYLCILDFLRFPRTKYVLKEKGIDVYFVKKTSNTALTNGQLRRNSGMVVTDNWLWKRMFRNVKIFLMSPLWSDIKNILGGYMK